MSKQGCCVDGSCDPSTCMVLPDGFSCGDCRHLQRCTQLFGAAPERRFCDFFPRRFVARSEASRGQP